MNWQPKKQATPAIAKVLLDIQDYHAAAADLSELASVVDTLAAYHFVPAPQNYLFKQIFERELPEGTVLTEDGMVFELPPTSDAVLVLDP